MRQSGGDSMAWPAERIADSRLLIDAPIALLCSLLASLSTIPDDTRNTEHVSPGVDKSTDERRAGTWVASLVKAGRRGRHHILSQAAVRIGQPSLPPRFLYPHLQAQSLVHVPNACRGQGGMSTDPDLLNTWQPWLGHGVVV